MSDGNKGKAKFILAWLAVLPFLILTYYSSGLGHQLSSSFRFISSSDQHNADTVPESTRDTLPLKKNLGADADTTPLVRMPTIGTEQKKKDTSITNIIDTFNFRSSKDSINAPVKYHADDSMVLDVPTKKLTLYGKTSSIDYSGSELSAPQIEYDQRTNLIRAFLKKDTAGKVIAFPAYNANDFKSVSDTIEVNMKSGRGLTKGTYTQQGEMFVYGEKIKRVNEDVFYAYRGRFTTCNLDTPHFAFISSRIKFINKKMAFSGPVHPEFEGVPLPIYLPFGIFPLTQGRHSGLLAPSFTANEQLGFALENLGYYKIISPNLDALFMSEPTQAM